METSAAFSLDSGQWTEERASLLAKLELLEHTKNEEMQNLKTSLIAEQQVSNIKNLDYKNVNQADGFFATAILKLANHWVTTSYVQYMSFYNYQYYKLN